MHNFNVNGKAKIDHRLLKIFVITSEYVRYPNTIAQKLSYLEGTQYIHRGQILKCKLNSKY